MKIIITESQYKLILSESKSLEDKIYSKINKLGQYSLTADEKKYLKQLANDNVNPELEMKLKDEYDYENIPNEKREFYKNVLMGYIKAALFTDEEELQNYLQDKIDELKNQMGYDDDDEDEVSDIDMIIKSYSENPYLKELENKLINGFDENDINSVSKSKTRKEIEEFINLLSDTTLDEVEPFDLGMDFWLTRNHHGSGFWDKGYSEEAEEDLMSVVKNFKEKNLIIGDDMMLYFE